MNNFIDGYEFVDLGLPSGTLWATCNVGANTPEETGDYFAYGEVEKKDVYKEDTYSYIGGNGYFKYTISDKKTILEAKDDAARRNMGAHWHTPTKEQYEELMEYCDVYGGRDQQDYDKGNAYFKSKINGNQICLPQTGHYDHEDNPNNRATYTFYLTSTASSEIIDDPHGQYEYNTAICFDVQYYDDELDCKLSCEWRWMGFPVRAVCDGYPAQKPKQSVKQKIAKLKVMTSTPNLFKEVMNELADGVKSSSAADTDDNDDNTNHGGTSNNGDAHIDYYMMHHFACAQIVPGFASDPKNFFEGVDFKKITEDPFSISSHRLVMSMTKYYNEHPEIKEELQNGRNTQLYGDIVYAPALIDYHNVYGTITITYAPTIEGFVCAMGGESLEEMVQQMVMLVEVSTEGNLLSVYSPLFGGM